MVIVAVIVAKHAPIVRGASSEVDVDVKAVTGYLFTRVHAGFGRLERPSSFGIVREQNLNKLRGDMKVGCL
jgi:hypothetical protein